MPFRKSTVTARGIFKRSIDVTALCCTSCALSFMKEGRTMCKISVIVPVYNAEDTLETALSSVFMQTLTDIEILCINDGSTDHSADVLTRAQRRQKGSTVQFSLPMISIRARRRSKRFWLPPKKAVPWSAAALLKKPRGTMCTPCLFSRRKAFITPAMSRSTVFSPALFIIAIFCLKTSCNFRRCVSMKSPFFFSARF